MRKVRGSPYRSCRGCGYRVALRSTFCPDCGRAFPLLSLSATLGTAAGLTGASAAVSLLLGRSLIAFVPGTGALRLPDGAATLAGAALCAVAFASIAWLVSELKGAEARTDFPAFAGAALLGVALGALGGKVLVMSAGLAPLIAVTGVVAALSLGAARVVSRRRPRPTLVEREGRIRAGLALLEAAEEELAAASARLVGPGASDASPQALAALSRAEAGRRDERARLAGALLRIELLRWGSRLKALSAGFVSLSVEACRSRRAALPELAAEGARMATRWRDEERSDSPRPEETKLLEAALGGCRKLDEALLVREVMLLSRPSEGLAGEGPELLLPDVDGLFAAALEGLDETERSAATRRRVDAELSALESAVAP